MTNGDIDKAIKHFKCVRDGAMVVLNTGFGTHEGEHDTVYRNRIKYADMAISALEHDRWIPVTERLPENKINPMTHDAYEYQCTANFGDETDVRCYKFWNGHWWHGSGNVDEYVTAWKERSEPYHPQELKYADADTAQGGLQPAT